MIQLTFKELHADLLNNIETFNENNKLIKEIDPGMIPRYIERCVVKYTDFIKGNVGHSDLDKTLLMETAKDTVGDCSLFDLTFIDFKKMLELAKMRLSILGRGKNITLDTLGDKIANFYKTGYQKCKSFKYWDKFSAHYRVPKGQLNILTGIPGHGKSEFLDMLLLKMVTEHNEKVCYFSPENYPFELHAEKIISKYVGKPFNDGQTQRMSIDEMSSAMAWMSDKYFFTEPNENDISLDAVLNLFDKAIKKGATACVIDPWNELESTRPIGMSETDHVGNSLMKCRRFARSRNVHFFIVAHPQKLYKDKEGKRGVPTPYDISGSAHWYNKADNCLTVYREIDKVIVYVQKIKFKMYGSIGDIGFEYNIPTGTYTEIANGQEGFNE